MGPKVKARSAGKEEKYCHPLTRRLDGSGGVPLKNGCGGQKNESFREFHGGGTGMKE